MADNEEFVMQGMDIADQVKEIFTAATGIPMVGLIQHTQNELFTFHQRGEQKQMIEFRWVVESVRETELKTLEPAASQSTKT